jgi:hypothetical protein
LSVGWFFYPKSAIFKDKTQYTVYMRNKRRLRAILFMPLGVVVFAIGWLLCSIPSRSRSQKIKKNQKPTNSDETIHFELIAKEEALEINRSVHK